MALAVAFNSLSNNVKTTIIEKISTILNNKYKIDIIKHDPKNKAIFDKEKKDSFRFFATGPKSLLYSLTRTIYFSHKQKELKEIVSMFGDIDLLLVKWLKNLPLLRICVDKSKVV